MPFFYPFCRTRGIATSDGAQGHPPSGCEQAIGVPYGLPSDLYEINRLDFQHFVLRCALQGNYAAPLTSPASILDVGTGTGRWAMDMAQHFPWAHVMSFDIKTPPVVCRANTAPGLDKGPYNYGFVAGNVLDGLPFADQSFDFVHQRLLFSAIPTSKRLFVVSELYRVTKPGGWIELAEGHVGYVLQGHATQRLVNATLAALLQRGIDPRCGPRLANHLEQTGLENVESCTVKLPVGAWGARIGTLLAANLAAAHVSAKSLMLSQGITANEWSELHDTMRKEWEQYYSTWPFYIAYGQRPV